MAQPIFAYIIHREGNADDSALEVVTAAGKIDSDAFITAIVAGAGDDGVLHRGLAGTLLAGTHMSGHSLRILNERSNPVCHSLLS